MTYTESKPTVFDRATTEAQIGDYFQFPGYPTYKVIAAVDLGDYVNYIVQSGSNEPEQFEFMKPEAELREQERNRIESDETEMSAIIHDASQEEIYEALGLLTSPPERYDWLQDDSWLTEPIGANPSYIFGMTGEQQAEHLPPVENAYHDENWTSDGCEF